MPASPAAAAGTCSIVVPARLVVDSPYELFAGRLANDCASADTDYATWDVRHAYYGPSSMYIFDSGETSDTWPFYDWERYGTHYVEPSWAYDSELNDVSQNRLTVSVRLGSRLGISTARSGNYVTVRATSTRYTPSASAFRPWRGRPVVLSYRTCSTCAWRNFKTVNTNTYGKIAYRVYAPRARDYRAKVADTSNTWGRTSVTSRR
jgi:hypothetical protein